MSFLASSFSFSRSANDNSLGLASCPLRADAAASKCYDHYATFVEIKDGWTRYNIKWSDFQQNCASNVPQGYNPAQYIIGISFYPLMLPPDLTIGDDVQTCVFLRPDRERRGIELGFLKELRLDPPQLGCPHPGREPPGELLAVDQPVRLRIAADERGREKHDCLQR